MKQRIIAFLILIIIVITRIFLFNNKEIQEEGVKRFTTLNEIKTYLDNRQSAPSYGIGGLETVSRQPATGLVADSSKASESVDFSTTNIQVEGVDEADIIKNDGKYLYILTSNNITIVDAYPAESADIKSIIDVDGYPEELFINEDKLIVFGRDINEPIAYEKRMASPILPPYGYSKSFIKVYDISDRESPELEDTILFDGSYYDSRMIGNIVYVILNQPVYYQDDVIALPEITINQETSKIQPADISYFDIYDYSYQLTTIMSIDLTSNNVKKESFLTGYTQNIFVSRDNIYLTSIKQIPYIDQQRLIFEKAIKPFIDTSTRNELDDILEDDTLTSSEKNIRFSEAFEDYFNRLSQEEKEEFMKNVQERSEEVYAEIAKETQKTIVHKISLNNIEYKSRGEVPGIPLNQFSMDEYKDNFRIATTSGEIWSGNPLNHINVLDSDMDIIGKAEDLAKGERIYSVRFMNDRAYIVTFKKIDPLFVIDLSNPSSPRVLGELKIPGYSDYLHPYDENHIIGIGKEAVDASNEESFGRDFAWYQGLKIALFDVSDPENPIEISKFNIGDRGFDSEALYEHKAFLFDKEKELLVIPVPVNEIENRESASPQEYGELVFDGAYVFSINPENGINLRGKITHNEDQEQYDYSSKIRRSLYIENVLYTMSSQRLKLNDLDSLEEIKSIELPFEDYQYIGIEPVILTR